jgi:hypothetical protein
MNEVRRFEQLGKPGDAVAIACTPDGSIVGVNDSSGEVRFYDVGDRQLLPLRFTPATASGVLLHPDGRVISYRRDEEKVVVRIHDPRSGAAA